MKSNEKRGKNKCKSIKRKCQVFKCFDSFMSGVCATPCHCDINEWRTKGCKKFIITEAIESVNYCFCFPFVSDAIFWYIYRRKCWIIYGSLVFTAILIDDLFFDLCSIVLLLKILNIRSDTFLEELDPKWCLWFNRNA